MSSAPFDIQLVIARLKAEVPMLQRVEGAAELGSVQQLRDFRTPSAYVLLAQETPVARQPGHSGGARRQLATVHFGVTLAVRNYSDTKGMAAADDLRAVLGAVRDALIGWVPPGLTGARDCQLIQGKVLDYDASALVWAELYSTQHSIGSTP